MKFIFHKNYIYIFLLFLSQQVIAQKDTLRYNVDDISNPYAKELSNLDFSKAVERDIQYNPDTNQYEVTTKIGDTVISKSSMTPEEYQKFKQQEGIREYWKQRVDYDLNKSRSVQEPDLSIYLDTTKTKFFKVNPFGSFDVIAGYRGQRIDNPTLPIRQRRTGGLDFDMNIRMGVNGAIADRLKFDANYNTETNFNFKRNQFKVGYQGKDDDILQEVEFGNVSLPLSTSLIRGNQSLLGVKSKFQFGRLTATTVLSQQESQQQGLTLEGGAQKKNFEVQALDYEENKHFFLGHYFRDEYEENLKTLPALTTPYNINRIQVWVTNRSYQTTNIREFVAFTDLGEANRISNPAISGNPAIQNADNDANTLYSTITQNDAIRRAQTALQSLSTRGLQQGDDFEIITARLLLPSEYTFNKDLGYISLNRTLAPDEVLAVAFEYTDIRGNVRRVGEFSENVGLTQVGSPSNNNSQDQMLVLKLLKPKAPRTDLPTWDLMMKNIYSLGAFQVDRNDFRLDVYYDDSAIGLVRYLPAEVNIQNPNGDDEDVPLIQVLDLDRFNASTIPFSDGVFDFLPQYTIDTRTGRLIFPVLEPFGSNLANKIVKPVDREKFVYSQLYSKTKAQAALFPEFNRYRITGTYKSKVRDQIFLRAGNIPKNSVTVRSGGAILREGLDYTVDYNLGRIKIINPALISSNVPLDVRFENNLQLGFQSKRLAGARLDYYVNDKLGFGATAMNLRERPFTNKVTLGNDPVSNTVLGADVTYETQSNWLTRVVDNIPLINTKAESSVNFRAEYARFMPGHAKQIGRGGAGQVYIDDFEGASSSYDLKFPPESWTISSVPRRFPESQRIDNLESNYNRAKIAWYNIDPILNSNNTNRGRPASISRDDRSDIYARQVLEREVFPNISNEQNVTVPLTTLDISYYPSERGPYNFNVDGLNPDGTLSNPKGKWAGIMRNITVTDFQAANIEFVEFWLMDPFVNTQERPANSTNKGKLVLNLGNISEDILYDGRMFFENGLPEPGQQGNLAETNLGVVPTTLNINNAFASTAEGLKAQDVGYDGLDNEREAQFFSSYLEQVAARYGSGSQSYQNALRDPAGDDFHHFLGDDYDAADLGIVDRYKNFSNPQGNSSGSLNQQNQYIYNSTNIPDSEDVNRDNTLERSEAYYEYEIDLDKNSLRVGQNFIVSKVETTAELANGTTQQVDWYQFKVPVNKYNSAVNNIQGFQSIRFIRMYLTEFEQPTTLRLARLNLLRNQWRRYEYELDNRSQPVNTNVDFNVFPINIEENQNKQPFPYVLPPGIQREQIQGAANSFLRNEQSLAMNVCALPDGKARAIYKLLNLDLRLYDEMKMFVHAERTDGGDVPAENEFKMFIRVGTDFSQNYYEYSQPVKFSQSGQLDQYSIWPEENNVNVNIKEWVNLKKQRNRDGASPITPFYNQDGSLAVVGSPDLGRSAMVMIGFENVRDNGLPSCAEFWVNELRVSGLNENSGYAALASADIQLADFGALNMTGNLHSAGYGNIEQRVDDRFRDDFTEFGINFTGQLDKFLPAKSTVRLPVYASWTRSNSLPEYNPYQTDLKLKESSEEVQEQLRDQVDIKTINFSNIRKERKPNSERKPKVYDVENFNLSYSYTEKKAKNEVVANSFDRTHYGSLGYNFSPQAKPIRPFYGLVKEQKYLQWIKEFNINPIPSNLSFTTDMTNRFQETALRDIQDPNKALTPYYFKDWRWNRNYDLQWNLTNSLGLTYSASNQALIDQPNGRNNTQFKKDSVWNNIRNFGRNTLYQHNASATYSVPFKYVPILDWMNVDVNYNTNYEWLSAPQEYNPSTQQVQLNTRGNAIRNTQGIQVNTSLDFNNLYNKSGFLSQYSTKTARKRPSRTRPDQKGKTKKSDNKQKPKKANKNQQNGGLGFIIKPLTSIKRVTVNYTDQRGTFVPGFMPTPEAVGLDLKQSAPGVGFVFGHQPSRNWLNQSAEKGWITKDTTFSYQYLQDRTRAFRAQADLQPFNDLNLVVNLDYSKTNNYSELFRNTGTLTTPDFQHLNPNRSGAYNISFISLKTLFDKTNPDEIPEVFRTFEKNRIAASSILASRNPNSTGNFQGNENYKEGYGPYSPDVIIPSFIAAYTGKTVEQVELNPFKTAPLPNWSLNYNGLTRLPMFAKTFSSFRLQHAYKSTFSINQYNSNLKYEGPEDYFLPTAYDQISNNYQSFYYIPQILIKESFSPLAGFDFATKGGLTMRANYAKSRTLGMSLLDYQLSENKNTGITIGAGYQTRNFKIPLWNKVLKNDIIFRLDYNYQDDIVTNYKLDQNVALPTRGAKTVSFFPTIDYTLNDRMNMQLYFDRRRSEPKTRSSYPITNNRGGMKLSYTFNR